MQGGKLLRLLSRLRPRIRPLYSTYEAKNLFGSGAARYKAPNIAKLKVSQSWNLDGEIFLRQKKHHKMRLREANCNTNSGLDNFLEKNKDQKEGLSTEYLVYAALDLKFFDILETLKDNCQHLLMFILQLYVHFVPNLVGPSRDSFGFTLMNGQGEKRVGLREF